MKNVLFVCTANVDRSRTAMDFYQEQFTSFTFRSAGTNQQACEEARTTPLTQDLIDWADTIIVMEQKHADWIAENLINKKKINVLNIPDEYRYYSIKLIQLLQEKMSGIL